MLLLFKMVNLLKKVGIQQIKQQVAHQQLVEIMAGQVHLTTKMVLKLPVSGFLIKTIIPTSI